MLAASVRGGHTDQTHGRAVPAPATAVDIAAWQARVCPPRRSWLMSRSFRLSRTCANRGTGARPFSPRARTVIRRDTVLSVVTPDDFASEAEAQLAAEKLIRK